MRRVVLALVVGLVCAWGCVQPPPIEGAKCNANLGHPCPKPYSCLEKTCQLIQAPYKSCTSDLDCEAPFPICLEGWWQCVQCAEDQDCPGSSCLQSVTGFACGCVHGCHCYDTGYCQVGPMGTGFCSSCVDDSQCDPGCTCENNACTCVDEQKCGVFQPSPPLGGREE